MKPMRPSRSPRALALLRTFAALTASLALLLPTVAFADTEGTLPQGYHSDSLPPLPPSQVTQNVDDTRPPETLVDEGYADTDPSALTDFREPLAPYGAWVVDPTYGTVWVPDSAAVGSDFAPYQTAGHWALTEYDEWIWVSDYDWGYIPFHYGRWVWLGSTGWAWIPGRVYAPAWVVWRVSDVGYIGWAPMPPSYYWANGYAWGLWVIPPAPFVFCSTQHIFHTHVHTYVVHDHETVHYAAQNSHVYRPAHPGHGGATPAKSYKPATPSLADAKIPKVVTPKDRVQVDRKALALAKPAASSGSKPRVTPRRGDVRPQAMPSPRASSRLPGAAPSPRTPTRIVPTTPDARPRQPVLRTPRAPAFTPPARSVSPSPRAPAATPRAPVVTPQAPVVQAPRVVPRAPVVAPRAPVKVAPRITVPKRK